MQGRVFQRYYQYRAKANKRVNTAISAESVIECGQECSGAGDIAWGRKRAEFPADDRGFKTRR